MFRKTQFQFVIRKAECIYETATNISHDDCNHIDIAPALLLRRARRAGGNLHPFANRNGYPGTDRRADGHTYRNAGSRNCHAGRYDGSHGNANLRSVANAEGACDVFQLCRPDLV